MSYRKYLLICEVIDRLSADPQNLSQAREVVADIQC